MSRPVVTENFETFGDYVLLKRLALGGMAEVFVARPARASANGRVVVLKRVLREVANEQSFIQMFQSEILVTLGFNHPHTIHIHDFGEIDGQPYLVMEYIEGRTLRQVWDALLRENRLLHPATILELLSQAASGLAYAHDFENTITGDHVHAIHRDVSPQNLMVSFDGHLKVIDFGIAKAENSVTEKTRAGMVKGKCAYMSPDQLQSLTLDGRSDVFSLGIVGWELLTGQRLFQKPDETEMMTMQRILKCDQTLVPPSSLNPQVPPEVDQVILKALQLNRDQRYKSASEFQAALAARLRQFYPSYSHSNTADVLRGLFKKEILSDRLSLRELNAKAQKELAAGKLNAAIQALPPAAPKKAPVEDVPPPVSNVFTPPSVVELQAARNRDRSQRRLSFFRNAVAVAGFFALLGWAYVKHGPMLESHLAAFLDEPAIVDIPPAEVQVPPSPPAIVRAVESPKPLEKTVTRKREKQRLPAQAPAPAAPKSRKKTHPSSPPPRAR